MTKTAFTITEYTVKSLKTVRKLFIIFPYQRYFYLFISKFKILHDDNKKQYLVFFLTIDESLISIVYFMNNKRDNFVFVNIKFRDISKGKPLKIISNLYFINPNQILFIK